MVRISLNYGFRQLDEKAARFPWRWLALRDLRPISKGTETTTLLNFGRGFNEIALILLNRRLLTECSGSCTKHKCDGADYCFCQRYNAGARIASV
jgi:hypothetical protein